MYQKREDIPDQYKWDLSAIYPNEQKWKEDYISIKESLARFAAYHGKLNTAKTILEVLYLSDQVERSVMKLYVYAHLHLDEDTTNSHYQSLVDQAGALAMQLGNTVAFIVPELLAQPAEFLQKLIAKEEFGDYKKSLTDILRQKEHTLSQQEEELLALTQEISHAPQKIYTLLNNADFKFGEVFDGQENKHRLSQGSFLSLMQSKDRTLRKNAFKGLYKVYREHENTLGTAYLYHLKTDIFKKTARKYETSLAMHLDQNKIPETVYTNLINTVKKNISVSHSYISLRKDLLGCRELHMYDIYAPLVEMDGTEISFEKARAMVLEGLKPLGENYQQVLNHAFNDNWIDIFETPGKKSGAYNWGAYDTHPYILLNYDPRSLNSVFTLAHELGHACHSYFSKKLPYPAAGYAIFVAEVASTVNEVLMTYHLLDTLKNSTQKAQILNNFLDQIRGSLIRQTKFAEFELITHHKAEDGEPLTSKDFSEIYYDLNQVYYGKDLVLDQEISLEWARIPHFYTSFYVYQYATGIASALNIAEKIYAGDTQTRDNYLRFLHSGSKDYPIELLKIAGVDIIKPEVIDDALQIFKKAQEELKTLIG